MRRRPSRTTTGFTLVELLVVIAIIGLLVGMLLPAVQAARESAREADCHNRLRQLGLATLLFHDSNNAFPPARVWDDWVQYESSNAGYPSWLARVLPYLEESAAHKGWDFSKTFTENDPALRGYGVGSFICPSRRSPSEALIPPMAVNVEVEYPCGCLGFYQVNQESGGAADYGGNHGDLSPMFQGEDPSAGGVGTGVIVTSRPKRVDGVVKGWRDRVSLALVTDGISKTTLAGEMFIPPDEMGRGPFDGPMYNGRDLGAFTRFGGPGGAALARSPDDSSVTGWALSFGSWHPSYCPFVFADGSVRRVATDVDINTYAQMMNRHDAGGGIESENEVK